MKQLYKARGSRQVKQPVPTAVNEGNHMKKMRAVLIGMLLAAAQLASAPVSADATNTFQNQPTPAAPNASASIEMQMKSIKLTPEQVEAIQQAHNANPRLSVKEVLRVVPDTVESRSSGSDEEWGDCSLIQLWGDDQGNYIFDQWLTPQAGDALFGDISISTNDPFASTHYRSPIGPYQHYEGPLFWIGWFPSATTMDGWMVTSAGNLCYGNLWAQWQ